MYFMIDRRCGVFFDLESCSVKNFIEQESHLRWMLKSGVVCLNFLIDIGVVINYASSVMVPSVVY